MFTYAQVTGALYRNGTLMGIGYSGRDEGSQLGLNNPALQCVRGIGPIPVGQYTIEDPIDHAMLGPLCFTLTPKNIPQMCGRSGFAIHGDKKPPRESFKASHGCIVMERPIRVGLATFLVSFPVDRKLVVVSEYTA